MRMKRIALMGTTLGLMISCGQQENKKEQESYSAFEVDNLDSTIAPCEDFFAFTTNGWMKANPIPETEGRWGNFNILAENNNKKVRDILLEISAKKDLKPGSDEQLVGDFFASGMDSIAVEEKGVSGVLPLIEKIENAGNTRELAQAWMDLGMVGVDVPFGMYVSNDPKNINHYVLNFGQSGLGLPERSYYLAKDSMSLDLKMAYREHVQKMFELFGEEDVVRKANTVLEIETRLAGPMMAIETRRIPDSTYHMMSTYQFLTILDQWPMEDMMKGLDLMPDSVLVAQPRYFDALNDLLMDIPLKDWKTYSRWQVLHAYAGFMPHAFVQADFDFFGKRIGGSNKLKPRWKRVLSSERGLQEQLGHLFVDRHFSPESKERVEKMVEDLRAAYRQRINGLAWMSDETKQKALEKLNAFTYKIGYPDKWKDYSDLKIVRDDYLANGMSLTRYKSKENLEKLGKPVDKGEWYMGAYVVNAYYNPYYNEVVFPAGILQPPFFDPKADDAINYGGIGGVIGHEFTHGFDDQGSKFNAEGNFSNWWTEEDRARFDSLAQEIVEQYNGYSPIPGANVNGQLTLGENIADLGGLTLAYHAYLISREGKDEVAPIDGFTDDQRVFLGWAQVWQSNGTDDYYRTQVKTDPHSPAPFRVNGTIRNIPEFYSAFGCKEPVDSSLTIIW